MLDVPVDDLPGDGGGGAGGGVGAPEAPTSGDWAAIAGYPAGRTEYKSAGFAGLNVGGSRSLNGTYVALAVDTDHITLSNPEIVNPNWSNINVQTDTTSASLSTSGERWVGPFVVDLADLDRVLTNFVALQGLYSVDSKKGIQRAVNVSVLLELTPVNDSDIAIGPAETFGATVIGDDRTKNQRAVSLTAEPSFTGRCQVRARRTSPTNPDFKGNLVDEVKWRDAYGQAQVNLANFGDVTTVQTRTYATAGATSIKDRKFNCAVTRKVKQRVDGEFTVELAASDRIDDIVSAMSLDPYIGNRKLGEIDFDNLYETVAAAEAYFGSELAVQFGYTFDDDSLSFEETLAIVLAAGFCVGYRQGSLIRFSFEAANNSSVLLFNHRNTLPRTQKRTVSFGVQDDHDGVELDWTAPKDGAQMTYNIPADKTAVSPRKVDAQGVRSYALAFWHAWRAWNKFQYQTVSLEQECTQEAGLVIPTDRVLITDQTRPPGFEGEVRGVDGLDLFLSQPVEFAPGVDHTIFLQHIDATVEALPVVEWTPPPGADPDPYRATLSVAPRLDLAVGDGLSARPGYEIVPATDGRSRAFLITERAPNTDFTENVKGINYTFLYYQMDELVLWLNFDSPNFFDTGPYLRDGIGVGGATTIADAERGVVYNGGAGRRVTFPAFDPPASYTKSAWIKRGDLATAGSILEGDHETFGFVAGPNLQAGHDGAQVSAPWPDATDWHHALVTYDDDDGVMTLYIDGLAVDEDAVASRVISQQAAFRDVVARVDDLRLWKRALLPREALEVYRGSRIRVIGNILAEDGVALATEDGRTLILE